MLTKILLVAVFILLSWNSFKLSESNTYFQAQINEVITNSASVKTLVENNQKEISKNTQTLKQLSNLTEINDNILQKLNVLEKQLLTAINDKKLITKIESRLDKQFKLLNENKKSLIPVQKSIAELSKIVKSEFKNQTKSIKNHSHKSLSCNNCASGKYKQALKKNYTKKILKPDNPKKLISSTQPALFKKIAIEFYKTKELYRKKSMKEALDQLANLKTEVWKSRKYKNISRELVMSILSSIDIAKNKWSDKKNDHTLDIVEEKINLLYSKLGFYK